MLNQNEFGSEKDKCRNEKLTSALESMRATIPIVKVSRHYGIPQSTLGRHKKGSVVS